MAVVMAKGHFADEVKQIESQKETLLTQRGEARSRGEKVEQYDAKIKDLNKQKLSIEAKSSDVVEKLSIDLRANTAAAVELAGSAVSRDMIPNSIAKVAEVYLQREGVKPEDISSDYGKDTPQNNKPKAHSVHLNHRVIYVLDIPARSNKLITKILGETFDVGLAELDEMITLLKSYKEKGKGS